MRVFLPWFGEFGTELMTYAQTAYRCNQDKIVCFEEGKEAIYPDGIQYPVERLNEKHRGTKGSGLQWKVFARVINDISKDGGKVTYMFPDFFSRLPSAFIDANKKLTPKGKEYDFDTDICLFPRKRTAGHRRNWDGWQTIAERLHVDGIRTFSCGHRDSSFEMPGPKAWDFDNDLDASIWAIRNSKLRVGMITGLSVLSLMCARPVVVLTMPDGRLGMRGSDEPQWSHLRGIDYHKVGWDVWPLLGDVEAIVEKIKEELR